MDIEETIHQKINVILMQNMRPKIIIVNTKKMMEIFGLFHPEGEYKYMGIKLISSDFCECAEVY